MNNNEIELQVKHALDLAYCYDMGYDCGMHGANETNCCFLIFSTEEKMQAWTRGKNAAEKASKK